MPETCLKPVWIGATQDWKSCDIFTKNTCLDHSTGEKLSFTHDSIMIGYERGLPHEHSRGYILLEECIVLAVPLSQ